MDVEAARNLCLNEMAKWGLLERGYRFEWIESRGILGQCSSTLRIIRLSRPFVRLNPEAIVRDTVLHEIAHALAGCEHGHDRAWKAWCVKVGAKPERCKSEAGTDGYVPVPGRYELRCSACREIVGRFARRPKESKWARYHHTPCGKEAGRIVIVENKA